MVEETKAKTGMIGIEGATLYIIALTPPFLQLYIYLQFSRQYKISARLLSSMRSAILLMSKILNLSATAEARVGGKTKHMGGRHGRIWRVNACRLYPPVIFQRYWLLLNR